MREVMDEYETDTHEGPVYVARPLECGHDADDGGGRPCTLRLPSVRRTADQIKRVSELQNRAIASALAEPPL